ncbi:hypothetical protein SH661x_004368 [Planctomicrobium sp. SH661]|uniref:phage major capsid protein n=1 Tax=Planctomicrobium sp. SH661 TaxID=3448124 RepID=UPI003F5AF276
MPNTNLPPDPRQLPADFRIIEAHGTSDFRLEATDPESSEPRKLRRFSMTAYTGGKLLLANFPFPVVVDLSGLRIPAKSRPILRDHDSGRIVGHTETIEINGSSIRLAGIVSGSNDHAREVSESGDNGFPWQASIGASAQRMVFVDRGETVEVNGRKFTGPLYVARQSTLREVSFVALGADDQAIARMAAGSPVSSNRIEVQSMEFEQWVQAQGFDINTLSEQQSTSLRALFGERLEASGSGLQEEESENVTADERVAAPMNPQVSPLASQASSTPPLDPIDQLRKRWTTERKRITAISNLCAGKFPELEARAVDEGWDLTKVELELLRAERAEVQPIYGEDGSGRRAASLEAALCMTAGLPESRVGQWYDERVMNQATSRELQGSSLHMLLYEVIRATGGHIRPGKIDNDVIRAAFIANDRLIQASSGFSTISLAGILSNVASKTMLAAYEAVNAVATQICGATDVNDFKQVTRYRMTAAGIFQKVGADGEIKHAGLDEEAYTNQIETWGRMIALTRQMMINDDLGAFLQIPRAIGRMSALALEEVVFTLLLSNPNNFFSTNHKNYFEGAESVLDIESLTVAEQMFLDRVDSQGKPILVQPAIILVPTSLKVTAEQLFKELPLNQVPANNKAKPVNNPHAGKFRPICSPYLSVTSMPGHSSTAWYLLAQPNDVAALEIAYLRGKRVPTIESGETDFNTLGMQWRGYFDFGVAMQDHRAAVKSKGAA